MMRPAILLALSASTPPLIPRRASGSLSLDDKLSSADYGRIGYETSLQNSVQRGEAVTLEEAQQIKSSHGYASMLQKLVESGEAASLEEARQIFGARGHAAALQTLVDSGKAATLEDAQQILSSSGYATRLQNMVDRGDAATWEEAKQMHAARGHAAAVATEPLGATGFSMHGGISAAIKAGKYTRFPGVRWRKDSQKWRVQFSVKGKKVSLGSYASEEEAARVHDEYVRTNKLSRPLHFPQSGESSSNVFRERVSRKEESP